MKEAYETAASRLGNTPAVARSSYVDPRVVEAYQRALETSRRSVESVLRDLLA